MTELLNILIADDSLFMRHLTTDILKKSGKLSVVGYARDGKDAAQKCAELRPDVVIMDMIMGEYDGLYGVKQIMQQGPTPIIILSSLGTEDMGPVMEALKMGAVDYHRKPDRSSKDIQENDEELVQKVIAASYARLADAIDPGPQVRQNTFQHTFTENIRYDVVVIGSSTGGPTAIESIITQLPDNLSVPVVIAQHMPENFVPSFAQRLNHLTPLNVAMAKKDDELKAGHIYIAPGSRNMIVRRRADGSVVCDFTASRYKDYNFPSVTGLMLSVADVYGARAIGIILTGMGKDGSEGLKAIADRGGYTIAQSKETCVVFGMPKEAIDLGAVTSVVPLQEIGPFVVSCLE